MSIDASALRFMTITLGGEPFIAKAPPFLFHASFPVSSHR
jgi:hypothetical protein